MHLTVERYISTTQLGMSWPCERIKMSLKTEEPLSSRLLKTICTLLTLEQHGLNCVSALICGFLKINTTSVLFLPYDF